MLTVTRNVHGLSATAEHCKHEYPLVSRELPRVHKEGSVTSQVFCLGCRALSCVWDKYHKLQLNSDDCRIKSYAAIIFGMVCHKSQPACKLSSESKWHIVAYMYARIEHLKNLYTVRLTVLTLDCHRRLFRTL